MKLSASRALSIVAAAGLAIAGATVAISAPASAADSGQLKKCASAGKAPSALYASGSCTDARAAVKVLVAKGFAGARGENIACFAAPGTKDAMCTFNPSKTRIYGEPGEIIWVAELCKEVSTEC